jgi:hypothetical protein
MSTDIPIKCSDSKIGQAHRELRVNSPMAVSARKY